MILKNRSDVQVISGKTRLSGLYIRHRLPAFVAALGGSTLDTGEEAAFASVVETVAQVQPRLRVNAFVIQNS